VLAKGGAFVQATERSTIKLAVLEQELSKIRDQGVAVDCEEFLPGVMCIAAPIRNHDNVVVGAMSISGPFLRVQTSESEMIRQVIRASQVVSTALGYYEPSPQNT
jgi:IclR family acetate operon transcriptional repressor